jgi:hypothetical protein
MILTRCHSMGAAKLWSYVAVVAVVFVLSAPVPVSAQDDDCGNGLPCGALPWALPGLPDLQSPTPIIVTVNPAYTPPPTPIPTNTPPPTVTPTPTPFMSATPFYESDSIDDSIATIEGILDGTQPAIIDPDGNTFDGDVTGLYGGIETYFSYVKGVSQLNVFGQFTPLVGLFFFVIHIQLVLSALRLTVPVVGVLVGIVRKIIQIILDFIPG